MSKITERLQKLGPAAIVLSGAMVLSASSIYVYSQLTTVAAAEHCEGLVCDPDDADDCTTLCSCNDPTATCHGI